MQISTQVGQSAHSLVLNVWEDSHTSSNNKLATEQHYFTLKNASKAVLKYLPKLTFLRALTFLNRQKIFSQPKMSRNTSRPYEISNHIFYQVYFENALNL